jgi:hypothetical protein
MPRNYKPLFAALKKIGKDYKEAVYEFTDGRTESPKDLSDGELKELVIRVNQLKPGDFTPKPGDQQRKKFISIAGKMNWGNTTRAIVDRLDHWCLKQKYRKKLNDLTVAELNVLLTVFESKVYTQYLTAIHK